MKLCWLKCVLDGQLYRFTGIADTDTGIEDNVVINENIQKQLIIVILTFS